MLSFVSAPNAESPQDAGGNNVYDVTVQVSDGAATDSQAIAVTVTDVNEFAPAITSNGGGATATANVAENTTAVTTVTASDADLSASLSYSVSGGADAALFSINSITGALRFLTAPNAESPQDAGGNNVYDVTVQVSDGTNTDSQAIAVTVTDVNEPPVITSNGGEVNRDRERGGKLHGRNRGDRRRPGCIRVAILLHLRGRRRGLVQHKSHDRRAELRFGS